MYRALLCVGVGTLVTACVNQDEAGVSDFVVDQVATVEDGRPQFISGSLGNDLEQVASSFEVSAHDLELVSSETDELGMRHDKYRQKRFGLPVVGGDMRVHSEDGLIMAALTPAWPESFAQPEAASVSQNKAAEIALAETNGGVTVEDTELVYLVPSDGSGQKLSWRSRVRGEQNDGLPIDDFVFVDATTAELVDRHPQIHTARNRRTYDANNTSSITGTLVRVEGSATLGDAAVDAAHDNAGVTYDCYAELFNRDSYDNNGATLRSTAHHRVKYNNAFWNGSRMVYGDGDGTLMTSLSLSQEVVTHELTHAVTEFTSGLVYQNQSGALNEAWSDIFGAVCEIWNENGINSTTWVLGEDSWTPNTPGDGLRYMDDPTTDGSSTDYYPERYTGTQDNGGVHWNSGIANLAFVLAVEGGTHPRGKTNIQVPAIGVKKAGRIFYRAGAQYMGSNTNFAGARAATIQAAEDLYDSDTVAAIQTAWAAVGVGTAPNTPPGNGNGGGGSSNCQGTLQNGQPVSLSGVQGQQFAHTICIPNSASNVTIRISGGFGDADLYVREGSTPTLTNWDYRPYRTGNNETVNLPSGSKGEWRIMVNGYSSFQSASLWVTWSGG